MHINTANGVVGVKLTRPDLLHIGTDDTEWWSAMSVCVTDFGNGCKERALKIDFDLRALYHGSDGAFYLIHGLGADQVTFGDLVLTRVPRSTCEEDL